MKKTNVNDVVRLKKKGLTHKQIGNELGIRETSVSRVLRQYKYDLKTVESFEKDKVNVLIDLQRRIVNSITDEDLLKLNAYQKTTMIGILIDKTRLIQGQSTSNQAVLFHIVEQACKAVPASHEEACRNKAGQEPGEDEGGG